LLHLYPLTQNTLQWEPRDKLESFLKLGDYFTIFHVIKYMTWNELLEIVSQMTGSSQLPYKVLQMRLAYTLLHSEMAYAP